MIFGRAEKNVYFCTRNPAKEHGALVQLVRIHACHAWGHGFESRTHRIKSPATPMSIGRFLFSSGLILMNRRTFWEELGYTKYFGFSKKRIPCTINV